MISFLFNNTALHNLRRRRRSVLRTADSCRDLENADVSQSSSECVHDDTFRPNEQLTLFQAKALVSNLERELNKQKNAKARVMQLCLEDCFIARARRDAGCRRGFVLSINKMKKRERDREVFDQAIDCLETLLLVITTEIRQVEAIAGLSGGAPSGLKLYPTAASLRAEIDSILEDTTSHSLSAYEEDEALFRELKGTVPVVREE